MSNLDKICALIYEKKHNISNLVLQKFLYFIQAYNLVKSNEPAFTEEIEAWMYGPVVPEAYYNVKTNNDYYKGIDYKDLNENIKQVTEEVVEVFGNFSPFVLVDLTHSYDPWKNAWDTGGWNTPITIDSIKQYHFQKALRYDGSIF